MLPTGMKSLTQMLLLAGGLLLPSPPSGLFAAALTLLGEQRPRQVKQVRSRQMSCAWS